MSGASTEKNSRYITSVFFKVKKLQSLIGFEFFIQAIIHLCQELDQGIVELIRQHRICLDRRHEPGAGNQPGEAVDHHPTCCADLMTDRFSHRLEPVVVG